MHLTTLGRIFAVTFAFPTSIFPITLIVRARPSTKKQTLIRALPLVLTEGRSQLQAIQTVRWPTTNELRSSLGSSLRLGPPVTPRTGHPALHKPLRGPNSTREPARAQEGEKQHSGKRACPNTSGGASAGITANSAGPHPCSSSPLVANRSQGAVQRRGTGAKTGQAWVAKKKSVVIPSRGPSGNANCPIQLNPPIEPLVPSLNAQEFVLNTPPHSQIPLSLVPFQGDNGMGSSRKRLSHHSNSICVVTQGSDSQVESPRPPKRTFILGGSIPSWDGAGPSRTPVDSVTITLDSPCMPRIQSAPSGNAASCATWDLVPATISGHHEEAGDAHLQYAWTSVLTAEGERLPFAKEPAGSS